MLLSPASTDPETKGQATGTAMCRKELAACDPSGLSSEGLKSVG
jgi:hypothetical protein